MVKLLANPILLRAAIVFLCSAFAFLIGLIAIRMFKRNVTEGLDIGAGPAPSLETLPLHVYNMVIQQLKQQKHELQVQSQTEQRRARTTENLSQAVLSNLSCGVVVFGMNGLVKQTNPAAREILGFASPTGMSADAIFRGSKRSGEKSALGCGTGNRSKDGHLVFSNTAATESSSADEVYAVLHEGSGKRQAEVEYVTPAGEKRHIALTTSPVPAADGSLLGATCLINDVSEFQRIRQEQQLQREISAEMALELRNSLNTISDCAQRLANSRDPELARQLSSDIANETAHLNRSLGGFLTERLADAARDGCPI
ncbi:MAG TPA: hypothetical protein VFO39_12055 [Candidatus Sulfotelmatobacter sp.]|nr:hypothetical protein [Candidatus Sulfotelmatobacter sp.]